MGQLEGWFYQDKSMVGWKNDIDEGSPWMVAQKWVTSKVIEDRTQGNKKPFNEYFVARSLILKISFQDIKHVSKTQLLPQAAIRTNIHQALAIFIGCISIKTSYMIAEGTEMYFAQIKTTFKIT